MIHKFYRYNKRFFYLFFTICLFNNFLFSQNLACYTKSNKQFKNRFNKKLFVSKKISILKKCQNAKIAWVKEKLKRKQISPYKAKKQIINIKNLFSRKIYLLRQTLYLNNTPLQNQITSVSTKDFPYTSYRANRTLNTSNSLISHATPSAFGFRPYPTLPRTIPIPTPASTFPHYPRPSTTYSHSFQPGVDEIRHEQANTRRVRPEVYTQNDNGVECAEVAPSTYQSTFPAAQSSVTPVPSVPTEEPQESNPEQAEQITHYRNNPNLFLNEILAVLQQFTGISQNQRNHVEHAFKVFTYLHEFKPRVKSLQEYCNAAYNDQWNALDSYISHNIIGQCLQREKNLTPFVMTIEMFQIGHLLDNSRLRVKAGLTIDTKKYLQDFMGEGFDILTNIYSQIRGNTGKIRHFFESLINGGCYPARLVELSENLEFLNNPFFNIETYDNWNTIISKLCGNYKQIAKINFLNGIHEGQIQSSINPFSSTSIAIESDDIFERDYFNIENCSHWVHQQISSHQFPAGSYRWQYQGGIQGITEQLNGLGIF